MAEPFLQPLSHRGKGHLGLQTPNLGTAPRQLSCHPAARRDTKPPRSHPAYRVWAMGGAQWGLEPRELTRVLRFGQDLSPTRCWLLSFCSVQVAGRAGTGRGHKWGHKNTSPCGHTVTLLMVTPILGERGRGLPGPEALGCVTCCWPPTWRFSSSGTCTRFPKGKAACRSTPQFPRELFPGFLGAFFFLSP